MDAVADDELAGEEALEIEAIHFIAREPGHDRHGAIRWSGYRALLGE